jgi:hypothetical protein
VIALKATNTRGEPVQPVEAAERDDDQIEPVLEAEEV